MKLVNLLIAGIFIFALSSCSKEGDEEYNNLDNNGIVGKWVCTQVISDVKTNNTIVTEKILESILDEAEDKHFLEFAPGGKCLIYYDEEDFKHETAYSLIGNKLTITDNGHSATYHVSLDGNTIILHSELDNFFDLSDFAEWGIASPETVLIEKAICQYYYTKQ